MGRNVKVLEHYTSEQIKTIIGGNKNHRLDIRLYAVYQLSKGKPSRELADLYHVSFKQICNWASRFDKEGISGLLDKPRKGRPRRLTQDQLCTLRTVLLGSAEQQGYNTANWSAPLVRDFIKKQFLVAYQPSNVYNLIHSLGFSYQKAKGFFPERDEQAREKAKIDIKKH